MAKTVSSPAVETFAAGIETAVDVAAIEKELHELWHAVAETQPGSPERQIARASLFNFVVFCRTEAHRDHATQVLSTLTSYHPCRAMVLVVDPESPKPQLSAAISAHCHLAAERKQVCCEQITFHASGTDVENLSATVLPLLESDLPTVVWWQYNFLQSVVVFRQLVDAADQIIYDTSSWDAPENQFGALAEIIAARQHSKFADLSWTRLGLWRELAADFFDDPSCRAKLNSVRAVEIEHGCGPGAAVRAELLASWFAAQLQWPAAEALAKIRLTEREDRDVTAVGIISFVIRASDARFSVRKDHGELAASAVVEMPNVCSLPRKQAFRPADDASLLSQELDRASNPFIYERALRMASQLFGRAGKI